MSGVERSAGTLLESSRAAVIWSCQGCVDGKLWKTDRRNFWPCLTLDNHPTPQPGSRACMATSTSNGIFKTFFPKFAVIFAVLLSCTSSTHAGHQSGDITVNYILLHSNSSGRNPVKSWADTFCHPTSAFHAGFTSPFLPPFSPHFLYFFFLLHILIQRINQMDWTSLLGKPPFPSHRITESCNGFLGWMGC